MLTKADFAPPLDLGLTANQKDHPNAHDWKFVAKDKMRGGKQFFMTMVAHTKREMERAWRLMTEDEINQWADHSAKIAGL